MSATPVSFRKHLLVALVGLIALTGMATNAPAQCQLQKLLASDGASSDNFGGAVALGGDTAVFGVPLDDDLGTSSGSAYVFEKVGGVWTQTAKLNAANGVLGDEFGGSVAVSGDTALIGARNAGGQTSSSGTAYMFEKIDGTWTQTTELHAADGVQLDQFGESIALSGDTTIIGAPGDDDLGTSSGSAYVFEKVGGVWIQTGKLAAADGAGDDRFGGSVALSGDTVVIGARFDDDLGTSSGSAYVFEKIDGVWTQTAKLNAADGGVGDVFGGSVALSGNTAVIGARFNEYLGTSSGSAYVFEKVADVWVQTAKLTAPDGTAFDEFGGSVAVSGTTAVIGVPLDDDLGTGSGSAYVFEKIGGIWTQTRKLTADDGTTFDEFGASVAVSGTTAVIGARFDDGLLGANSGSVYVFGNGGDDCNNNDIGDVCDIASGTSSDCNDNGIPDECDTDSDGDGVIDDCDNCALPNPGQENCNNNDIGDVCDIASGTSSDCNDNGIPDECEPDSDGDGVIDDCDNCALPNPGQEDCNKNGVGDVCDTPMMLEETFSGGMFNSSPDVTWTNPSTGPGWFFASSSFSLPGDVMQSVDIGNGGTTAMSAQFAFGPAGGSVSFDWAVESESCCDRLLFSIDGLIQLDRRGFQSGSSTFPLGAGSHSFEWRYSKDGSVSSGADAGAIDNILFDSLGFVQDCNGNGVPDECDVDPGDPDGNGLVSPDCNTNGIPDECDLVSSIDFVHQSSEFSPFQFFADATEVIPSPPPAIGDVTLRVDVKADLGDVSEFVDVFLNGMSVGRLFEAGGAECPATFGAGSLVIAEATFNELLPGDVTVGLVPSAEVGFCIGVVKLRLSYTGGSNDCDGNGIPDDCDNDSDGDGVIDDCDPCPLDSPDDTDGDGVCDADDLCSDTPLGLLVDLDGCTLMVGPCCFPGGACIDETDQQTCEAFPDGVFFGEGLTCGDPDGDGVFGCDDGCPLDPAKVDPGVCGCGVADDDGDLDGVADCIDHCLQTPSDVPVNLCGCAEVGACCAAGGGCFDDIERTLCVVIAGIYQGDGSACAENCVLGDLYASHKLSALFDVRCSTDSFH